MKKKTALLVFFAGSIWFTGTGQTKTKCDENFTSFKDKTQAGLYNDALPLLKDLRKNCPKISDTLYMYGETVLKYEAEAARTKEDKQGYIDSLLALYSEQQKNFPGSDSEIKRALMMKQYGLAEDDEVFKILDANFNSNKKAFTDYNALQTYFMLYLARYESGKSNISQDDFIAKFGDISGQVAAVKKQVLQKREALSEKKETQMLSKGEQEYMAASGPLPDALDAVDENITILASKHFSCENLESYYGGHYNEHEKDADWLEAMVNVLYANKCFNSPVMYKGAKALHMLNPTADSAYRLGNIALKRRNLDEAMQYFNQSASLQQVPAEKAKLYVSLGRIIQNKDKAAAKEYLVKASELNPKLGEPYLLLAEMYATAGAVHECDMSDFDSAAINWLAIDTAKKAATAEPKYKPAVDAVVKRYQKKLPTKAEAKAAGKNKNDEVHFGCWINETITIPNL